MDELSMYLLIIWLIWVAWVSIAVYRKWTKSRNRIFYSVYVYLIIAFGILFYFIPNISGALENSANFYNIPRPGLRSLQHFIILVVFTAFLQISVWWFTRRWHRK